MGFQRSRNRCGANLPPCYNASGCAVSAARCSVPELPEVETVVRDLRPRLVGRRIASVATSGQALRKQWRADWIPLLTGRRVQEVRRRGKWIVIVLDGQLHLVMHLGMSGQLVVMPAKEP